MKILQLKEEDKGKPSGDITSMPEYKWINNYKWKSNVE